MIQIKAPDGSIIQFPDGTPDTTIEGVMKENFGGPQPQPSAPNWADVPGQALQNAPASAMEFGRNLIQPIIHPLDTLNSLGQLGSGAVNNAIPQLADLDKWMAAKGLKQASDPQAVAQQQQMASGVGQFFKDRYGSEAGWKNTIAKDPVGLLADASMVLSGGGTAAARLPGRVANIGSRALKIAGNASNPINAITKPAGLLAKPVLSQGLGLLTGAGSDSVMEAFRAGERGGGYGKSFRDNMRGNETQDAVLNDAHAALDKMVQDRRAEYNQGMAATKANKAILDYTPIEDAMQNMVDSLHHGPSSVTNDTSLALAKKVGEAIDEWRTNFPNPTAEDLDRLKVKIDKLKPNWTQESGDQGRIITSIRNAVKDEILRKDPNYAKTMKAYEDSKSTQTEIEKAMSLTGKSSKDTALRKLQSVMRDNANTNYGSRADNVRKLEATGAAPNIMAKLAGQQLKAITPRGLSKLATTALLGGAVWNPSLLAALPLTSPRLIGEAAHLLGRVNKRVPKVPLSAFQAGRAGLLGDQYR